jgi:hypothetical protein
VERQRLAKGLDRFSLKLLGGGLIALAVLALATLLPWYSVTMHMDGSMFGNISTGPGFHVGGFSADVTVSTPGSEC